MPSQKPIKLVSKQEEKELLAIGEELFRTEFPNPERSGCPGGETLRTLAFRSQHLPLSERNHHFDHMTCCSPCFNEFSAFVDQARQRKRLVVLGLCAVMFVTIGLVTWLAVNEWRHSFSRQGGSISQKPPSAEVPGIEKKPQKEEAPEPRQQEQGTVIVGQEPPAKLYQDVVLDVRDQAVTRGENAGTRKNKYPSIPRGRLNLSIYLPIGSEAGEYKVRVYDSSDKLVLDAIRTVKIRNRITVLKVKVDTSNISPGKCVLETRRSGWTSGYEYIFLVAE